MKTKEEQIIFQNQSHLVQRYFESCGLCPSLFDICLATDLMVRWAMEGHSKELFGRFENLDKYIKTKQDELQKK